MNKGDFRGTLENDLALFSRHGPDAHVTINYFSRAYNRYLSEHNPHLAFFAPEGHVKIARQFIAGSRDRQNGVPEGRLSFSFVPLGLPLVFISVPGDKSPGYFHDDPPGHLIKCQVNFHPDQEIWTETDLR